MCVLFVVKTIHVYFFATWQFATSSLLSLSVCVSIPYMCEPCQHSSNLFSNSTFLYPLHPVFLLSKIAVKFLTWLPLIWCQIKSDGKIMQFWGVFLKYYMTHIYCGALITGNRIWSVNSRYCRVFYAKHYLFVITER